MDGDRAEEEMRIDATLPFFRGRIDIISSGRSNENIKDALNVCRQLNAYGLLIKSIEYHSGLN